MSTSKPCFERAVLHAFIIGLCLGLASIVETRDTDVATSDSIDPLAKDLTDTFETLVRKRRQLGRRKDETKSSYKDEEKLAMLTVHNSHRSLVNPTASDMIELRWDEAIEKFAQDWANKCKYQHQKNRDLDKWINMGENIWFGTGKFSEKGPVDSWWKEVTGYTFETKACTSTPNCGHYITASWAKSDYVGCGIKFCPTMATEDPKTSYTNAYLIVCDYSGRFLSDTQPYQKGRSCSKCPPEYPKCRYNMCVTQSMLDNCEGYNGTDIYMSETRTNSVTDTMNCPKFIVDKVVTFAKPGNQGTTPSNQDSTTGNTDSTTKGVANTVAHSFLTLAICVCILSVNVLSI